MQNTPRNPSRLVACAARRARAPQNPVNRVNPPNSLNLIETVPKGIGSGTPKPAPLLSLAPLLPPPPPPFPKHSVKAGNVKGTVLLPSMFTVPKPGRSDRNNGAGAVASVVVLLVRFLLWAV